MNIGHIAAGSNLEVFHTFERKHRPVEGLGQLDTKKVGSIYMAQPKNRTRLRLREGEFDIGHFKIIDVAEEEAARGNVTELVWIRIWIVHRTLLRFQCRHGLCAAPFVLTIDIMDFNVLDGMVRNSTEDAASPEPRHRT